jgi:hypothetical protein
MKSIAPLGKEGIPRAQETASISSSPITLAPANAIHAYEFILY